MSLEAHTLSRQIFASTGLTPGSYYSAQLRMCEMSSSAADVVRIYRKKRAKRYEPQIRYLGSVSKDWAIQSDSAPPRAGTGNLGR
jgi:hypothetical protein